MKSRNDQYLHDTDRPNLEAVRQIVIKFTPASIMVNGDYFSSPAIEIPIDVQPVDSKPVIYAFEAMGYTVEETDFLMEAVEAAMDRVVIRRYFDGMCGLDKK